MQVKYYTADNKTKATAITAVAFLAYPLQALY